MVTLLEEEPAGSSWLVPRHIIVPSMDFGNWLQVRLANLGSQRVFANNRFYQPAEFIDHWSSEITGMSGDAEWNKKNMHWALYRLLPKLLEEERIEGLPEVESNTGRDELKWFRLAGHLADTYDKYMVFRPDWLWAWRHKSGEEQSRELPNDFAWQAELWRALCKEYPKFIDRAYRSINAMNRMKRGEECKDLPLRVLMVQMPSLPLQSARWFEALGTVGELSLLVLEWNPIPGIEQSNPSDKQSDHAHSSAHGHQRLSHHWSKQRREFFGILEGWKTETMDQAGEQKFVRNAPETNLQRLQQMVTDPVNTSSDTELDNSESPSTVQIHAAHGPLREVEALYEQLLHCFETDEKLRPDDILMVSPDMETYAPHINAVFGEPGDDDKHIPFHRFNMQQQGRYQLTELLIDFLKAARGRFKVTEILDLLAHPAVRSSMGLDLTDLEQIEQWLLDLKVRWGYDADHRREVLEKSRPSSAGNQKLLSEQNSWQHAMDRLWLGLSTRTEDRQFIGHRLPYKGVEGSDDSRRLGAVQRLIHQLWELHRLMRESRPLAEWRRQLVSLVRDWFTVERDREPDRQWLMEQLTSIDEFERLLETDSSLFINADILLDMLEEHILTQRHPVTRMAGRAVVSPMVPNRSIPFKIIALVGLNQDNFPGGDPANPFDATLANPREGDRSRRKEDRQLMLDYLLSARERLLITYTGKDQRNDEALPPSPMVTELLDMLTYGDGQTEKEQWITRHPLHGFEARPPQIDSYLESRVHQSKQAFGELRQHENQLDDLVGLDEEIPETYRTEQGPVSISVEELERFYRHPIKHYCEQRLGVRLREEEQVDTDEEPFRLGGLSRYQLYAEVLSNMVKDPQWQPDSRTYREEGMLPHGVMGQAAWRKVQQELEEQRDVILGDLDGEAIEEPVKNEIEFTIDGIVVQLQGESGLIAGEKQLAFKTGGSHKAKDRLRAWIRHLFCNAAGRSSETMLWGSPPGSGKSFKKQETFKKLSSDKALSHLKTLIRGQLIGSTQPLAYLPQSSFSWAETNFNEEFADQEKVREEALRQAASTYHDDSEYYEHKNESSDEYYQYFFHGVNPYKGMSKDQPGSSEQVQKLTDTAKRIWTSYWEGRS
mgnify:CR=1 FL=1